jgi:hypothetical protein
MTETTRLNPATLAAIDVHVHLESVAESGTDNAAREYFGDSGAPRDQKGLAAYYRSRKMACVVFSVDERLSRRKHPSNESVLQFAADNPDVAIAFVSVDPTRGPEAVRCTRPHSSSMPTTASRTRSTRCSPRRGCRCSFTQATAASAPASRAATVSG